MSRSIWITVIGAFAAFCFVQDLVTTAGTREYVRLYKQSAPVTVEQVMTPAVHKSVLDGLAGAAGVAILGVAIAAWSRRRKS